MTSVYAPVNLQTDLNNDNSTPTKRVFHGTPPLIEPALLEKTKETDPSVTLLFILKYV